MIYCVEDDKNIRELITYTLKTVGHKAQGFNDYFELEKALEKELPTLIILDIMLPQKEGTEILKELKENKRTENIPVIMLTAKGSEFDKVTGLDLGADDYITKPFGMMEMTSRVNAVLRRYEKTKPCCDDIYEVSSIKIDTKKHLVMQGSKELTLSYKEYELLKFFAENHGIVLSRDKILNEIWGYDYDGENRTVDVHIRALRTKLGDDSQIIQTIRNVGYKLGE